MENLIERLTNIAFLIGCDAKRYDVAVVEEVMNTIYEVKEILREKE